MKKFLSLFLVLVSFQLFAETLPKNIKWITNDKDPEWSDPAAKKGGVIHNFIMSFPLTLRVVGPDANSGFRGLLDGNRMGLVDIHPNTGNWIPALATNWAFDKDGKTVYFKLDPKAKWSDGQPVTVDDFVFGLEFMRSKFITDPWYNDYFTKNIEKVVKYDDHTMAIINTMKKPQKLLLYYTQVDAQPKHFYKEISSDWVKKYQWTIIPNTGPYLLADVNKGKSVAFNRKKDWWAQDNRYYRNRFNVDRIEYQVIRDLEVAWQYFLKGEIDSYFTVTQPQFWHEKTTHEFFKKGYIGKLWFYNDKPHSPMGFWLNEANPILSDKNVREAFAHALNVDRVLKTILRGDYERLNSLADGYGKYSNNAVKARAFDLKKAEELLNKSGWTQRGADGIRTKNGKRLSLTVTYSTSFHTDRLVIMKEDLKKAGIELNLKLLDGSAAFKVSREKQHEIAYTGFGTGEFPQYWEFLHSENANKTQTNNLTNTANKSIDDLVIKFDKTTEQAEHEKFSREIIKAFHDQASFVPLWKVPYFREAYWSWWKFPKTAATKRSDSAFDEFLAGGTFWLDQAEKDRVLAAKKAGQSLKEITIIEKKFKN